ncbi:YtzI protein [Solibacillus silvestris]|uniref:YtzI protein n=1 Tax=Solibacillus silvestris TaxID=76853 RepID=UPI003F7FDFDE
MLVTILICILVVIVITALFLTAVNLGYKVKHSIDPVAHNTTNSNESNEVKK